MKSVVAGLVLSICTISTPAVASTWKITEVFDSNKTTAGFIMHSYVKGTAKTTLPNQKFAAGLRFICAANSNEAPIVGLYWNNPDPRLYYVVTASIDGISYPPEIWVKDDTLIFTPASTIDSLVQKMKSGKNAKFHWLDQHSNTHTVVFDLEGIKFDEFNKSCKTRI